MWNMVITLTSAGYGELYPKSFFGRIVGVTICFWGVLIISLMVVAVTQTLEFTYNEERSYNLLIRLEYKNQLKKDALEVLFAAYAHRNVKRNHPNDEVMILNHYRSFRTCMLNFNKTMRLITGLSNGNSKSQDTMQLILESLNDILKNMGKQQKKTMKRIRKIYEMLEEAQKVDDISKEEQKEIQALENQLLD